MYGQYGFLAVEAFLVQGEVLCANECTVGEDVYPIVSGIEEFFYVPIDGDGLFFAVVFDIFLDRIA